MFNREKNTDIDVGLSVLCIVSQHGDTLTRKAISEVCGCTPQYIEFVEKRAIGKLKRIANGRPIHDFVNPEYQ